MPTRHHQLSLTQAIFINLNIILGVGIFINTGVLAQRAGALSGVSYIIIGAVMLPLIISIAKLLEIHPGGGFYVFGKKEIHPFAGFMSSWSYFTGKLASGILVIHASVTFAQEIIPSLARIDTILLDIILLSMFIALNMLNIKAGSAIQSIFLGFKIIPILFLLLAGLFLFDGANFAAPHRIWSGIPSTLPLVLYAMLGFEAAASLSSKIKDAHKNAPRAVLISYGIAILIACLYQLIFYGILGTDLLQLDYRGIYPALLQKLFTGNGYVQELLEQLLHIAITASALGSSYGIIFSNSWNLYTLAQHKHTFFPQALTQLNKHHIPWLCVLAEGALCLLYLAITRGNQLPLQQIGALGCTIGYIISAASLVMAKKNKPTLDVAWWIPILATLNCLFLISACIVSLIYSGAYSLLTFGSLLIFGIIMFWWTRKESTESSVTST